MFDIFCAWNKQAIKLKNGEITKDEYNNWRYNHPKTEVKYSKATLFNGLNNDHITSKTFNEIYIIVPTPGKRCQYTPHQELFQSKSNYR